MLRKKGHRRTFKQNMGLAVLLSLAAGCVNVTGFLTFLVLTTNVTGHVARFAEEVVAGNFATATLILLWMLLFLAGAFTSTVLIHYDAWTLRMKYPRTVPIIAEIILLILVVMMGYHHGPQIEWQSRAMVGMLFFAMGMQNALVTVISGSIVRTTHLTGLFTDLGIEIAFLMEKKSVRPLKLNQSIALHTTIIVCFFLGGFLASLFYPYLKIFTFLFSVTFLVIALLYTPLKLKFYKIRKRIGRKAITSSQGRLESKRKV